MCSVVKGRVKLFETKTKNRQETNNLAKVLNDKVLNKQKTQDQRLKIIITLIINSDQAVECILTSDDEIISLKLFLDVI